MKNKKYNSCDVTFLSDVPELSVDFDKERNKVSPSEIYLGSNKNYWWRCHECGHTWYTYTNARWHRDHVSGCPACSGFVVCNKDKHNSFGALHPEYVKNWVSELNGCFTPFDILPHVADKYWFFCKLCGKPCHMTPDVFVKSCGCAECKRYTRSSFGEQFLFYNIRKHFPCAVNMCRDVLDGGRELDVYIPITGRTTAVEYDGGRWHTNDAVKRREKYENCKRLGIRLIRVIENPSIRNREEVSASQDELYFVKYATDHEGLETVTKSILEGLGCECPDVSLVRDYGTVQNMLRDVKVENAVSDNEYLMKLWHPKKNTVNPRVVTQHSPTSNIWWICPRCGRDWKSSPDNVLHSEGCIHCSPRRKMQIEQWTIDGKTLIRTFESIGATARTLGKPVSTIHRILVRKSHIGLGFLWRKSEDDAK